MSVIVLDASDIVGEGVIVTLSIESLVMVALFGILEVVVIYVFALFTRYFI